MPKKYLFYLLGLLLLAGLGYYGYSKWTEAREKVDLWTLVPEDAVFVVESGNYDNLLKRLKHTQVWESLAGVTYFRRLEENMALIDSLGGPRNELSKFLATKTMLTSVHVLNKTDFDLVYYVPVSTVKEHRYIRNITEHLSGSEDFSHSAQNYQGTVISSLTNKITGGAIYYFTYRNNLILSPSVVLLEEIVRKIKYKRFESIAADFENIDYLNQEKVYANVFINFHNLPPFLGLFLKSELRTDVEYLCSLSRNSMLEFKLENNKIYLNGFSNPETLSQSFYRHISKQQPKPLTLQQYVSNRTALLFYFGVEQPWQLKQYTSQTKSTLPASGILAVDSLARVFSGEVALAYLQTSSPAVSPDKVIFAKTAQPARVQAYLKRIGENNPPAGKKNLYRERYGNQVISLAPVPELPRLLFGNLFGGFAQTYYVQTGDYFLFAANPATLRSLLADINTGSVWGKSVAQKAFLEETQHQSTFSMFVNSVNAWEMLNRYLKEDKREALLRHESLVKDFNQFSLQFSQVEDQFYTSLLLRQQDALAVEDQRTDVLEVNQTITFDSPLIAGLFAVRNPITHNVEMQVQDSAFVLHNINAEGKVSWADSVGEGIRGQVVQAPFGSDGKTKYLFATANKIHCLDRSGREVPDFPYYLPDTTQAQRLTVLDWNKSGDYRLLVDDEQGNLFMFDEVGDLLENWNPRPLDARLAAPPQLHRIGNKNVLLAVLENGYVYALNEHGETYAGFPFSVKATVRSGFFGKPGTSFRNSEFTLVTLRGEVVTFNLTGQVTKRHQLVRPERNATFELIAENGGKSYLIARQSLGRVTLLNPEFKLLLERKFFTSSRKIVHYYLFGGDKIVYAITETGPRKTYLFDGKAQPIGNKVIISKTPVKLYYNQVSDEYQLYKMFGNEVNKISLKH